MNKILRYTLLGGIFLIPFIPLIISGGINTQNGIGEALRDLFFGGWTGTMFFPFITGKNFAFRIITEILFGGWIILALRDSAYRLRRSWLFVAVAAFVGIIALADIFGENFFKSFWSNFERMDGLVTLIHLFAYFIVASAALNTEKLWTRFFQTSIGVSVMLGFYGIFQLAGVFTINQGGVRLDATFGNATYLAIYMLFHIFLTIFLLSRWRGASAGKWAYIAIIMLQTAILYFTATRGAILGFVGGILLAVILISIFEKERKKVRKTAVSALIAIFVLIGGFFAFKETQFIKQSPVLSRLSSISLEEGQTRFIVWNMAWQGFKEKPILGWGQENFNVVFNKYYDPRMYTQEPWFDRVHNIFFDWLIAGGALGLLAYLSLFGTALYYIWRKSGFLSVTEKSLFTGLLAGYFFYNFFTFDNIVSYILFFSVLAYVYSSSTKKIMNDETARVVVDIGTLARAAVPAVIVLTLFSIYLFNVKGIYTARALLQGLAQQKSGLSANLEFFKKALAYETLGRQEVHEQLLQVANRVRELDVPQELKQEFFTLGRDEMRKQIERQKGDARLELFMGSFLNTYGFYDDAFVYLDRARELSPGKQAILFEIGQNYLSRGDNDSAFNALKEAYELEPEYKNARVIYAVGAIYSGKDDIAQQLLTDEYGTVLVDDDRIIKAYFDTGRNDLVLSIWKQRAERAPENAQFRISLAAAYLNAGQRNSAIAEIEKAIELNPEFKEQGEFYIQEIRAGRNP